MSAAAQPRTLSQLIRYGFIGAATNGIGYALYYGITALGADPKITMSCMYLIGATASFFGNKKLTFAHAGGTLSAGVRYVIAHAVGYGTQLTLFTLLVDYAGYPHALVQAAAMFVVAAVLFVLFKFFVFPTPSVDDQTNPA
jgi:putative flippase GtrA